MHINRGVAWVHDGVTVRTATPGECAARIAELEAAILAITYESDGKVFPSKRDHIDLVPFAPILRDVHRRAEGDGGV